MSEDFCRLIEAVARTLLGEPNSRLSTKTELKFGNNGSMSVNIKKGVFTNFETNQSGGFFDLIAYGTGITIRHEQFNWLDAQGIRPNGSITPKGDLITHEYDYVDCNSKFVMQVVRLEPKSFRQRRRDTEGNWIWSVKDIEPVLYRLPEVIEAISGEKTIYIVEGEKDADNLWGINIPATTNPGGAGTWRESYNKVFANSNVVIIADNDPISINPKTGQPLLNDDGRERRTGQDHARHVAAQLKGIAASIKLLDLKSVWPACPDKGDISDWLDGGGTREQFDAIVGKLGEWNGEDIPKAAEPVIALADWLVRDLPSPDPIIGTWFTTTSRALLVAPTGIGKTMFGMGLWLAMSDGKDFLHWHGVRPCKVLFIDGEMSRRLLKQRLSEAVSRFGGTPSGFYALSHEDIHNFSPLNTPHGQACIEQQIKRIGGVDAIMFDNIMSLISGDQKDEEGWTKTLPWVKSLTMRGIGQIWVHHTGHDETKSYGTKTREWQMDTVIHLERVDNPDTDVSFQLGFRKARERTPSNRDEFMDAVIALEKDVWVGSGEASKKGKIEPLAFKFLEALEAAIRDNGQFGKLSASLNAWREYCVKRGLIDAEAKAASARSMFSKYKLQLIKANRIICNETEAWISP